MRVVVVLSLCATMMLPAVLAGGSDAVAATGPAAAGANGSLRFVRGGTWRELFISSSAAAADVRFNVATDKVATGSGQTVSVVARRVRNVGEYRVVIRFASDGAVYAAVVRLVRGQRTMFAPFTRIATLRHEPGTYLAARVRVGGVAATVIKVRIWPAGTSEPRRWSNVAVDRTAALAKPGGLALRFGIPSSSSNLPITYRYNLVRLTTVNAQPQPPGDSSPQPEATASPQPVQDSSPLATGSPVASAVPTPAATSAPTPTSPPSENPVPTATPAASPANETWPPGSYFVSTFGSDSADGSHGAPWRTLQKAADVVAAGSTVYVRQGTYAGFTMRRSGTAPAPITFAAYPDEVPVVDGARAVAYTVRLTGVRHVRLVGLTVVGGYAERHNGGGVSIENSDSIEVSESVITRNKAFGIRSYNSTNVVIADNEITANATGIYIHQGGEGTRVTDNLIYDNTQMMVNTADVPDDDVGAQAIALVRSTGRVTIAGNLIWGNRAPSFDYGYDGGAFAIHAASNWTITDNITWDNRNVLETGTDALRTPCDNGNFTRNLNYGATTEDRTVGMVLRCASNTLVANNTFNGLQYFVFAISHNRGSWGGSVDNLRVLNNIVSIATGEIFRIETDLPASVEIDNNLVSFTAGARLAAMAGRGSTASLATFRSWTGYEVHGIEGDPGYMDATVNDYRLRADSSAVDVGAIVAGVSDLYSGARPDLGYRELR
jgi:parallel beta-helix repeat protein